MTYRPSLAPDRIAYLGDRLDERLRSAARGSANAIPREQLLLELRCFEPRLDDRDLRWLYAELGMCVGPRGVYYPVSKRDFEAAEQYVTAKARSMSISARERIARMRQRFPEYAPAEGEQLGLWA